MLPLQATRLLSVRSHLYKQFNWASRSLDLKSVLSEKIPAYREEVKKFRKERNKTKIGEVTVGQLYGGMRGLMGLICETSMLDPEEGIKFRGYTIPELQEKLPKLTDDGQPLPEGLFWLLCTGDMPTEDQAKGISIEWGHRGQLPKHVRKLLNKMSPTVHPMAQFSAAIIALSSESNFTKAYAKGIKKKDYWEYVYEDVMDLLAKLVPIAATIYINLFRNRQAACPLNPEYDYSTNLCYMMGYEDEDFLELMRLYLTIHSDHEGGNVSAHTVHLVGSALSDPYLAFGAGMCGLAGPLHGLANQEVLTFVNKIIEELGNGPTDDQLKDFCEETLRSGQVIPGYGHAVLRKTDPRYTCQADFACKYLPEDEPTLQIVQQLLKVVPPILEAEGKVKNPWPNVDAHSGVLLQYYGMKEMCYYTVLFGVSRALGTLAQLIWSRALGLPIERPNSITTEALKKMVCSKGEEEKEKAKKCKKDG